MDQITLPMTIPELRVEGAPILALRADGVWCSGVYLAPDMDPNWCIVWANGGLHAVTWENVAINLHHPNGERIADLVLRPGPPTADRETLEAIRDRVLAAVSA